MSATRDAGNDSMPQDPGAGLLRAALDLTPSPVIVLDNDLNILLANAAACRQGRRPESELIGRPLFSLFPHPGGEEIIRRVLSTGHPYTATSPQRAPDAGTTTYWDYTITPLRDASGGVDGCIVVLTDVTAKVQAETDRSRNSAFLESLLESIPDVVMRFDRDCRLLYVSPTAARYSAFTLEEMLGKTRTEIGYPEGDARECTESIRTVFETGESRELELARDGPNGQILFNWRVYPERGPDGSVTTALALARDITEHRASEESYRALFASMHDGFALHEIICDETGAPIDYRFRAVNPAFERLTGLKARDVVGHTVREIIPDIEQVWIDRYGRVALEGTPDHFEDYNAAIGKYFDVTAYRPAPDQFACLFVDVTDAHEEERRRKLTLSLLEAMNRSSSEPEAAGEIVETIRSATGIEAVGLRLRHGDDYPYYQTSGFPAEFVRLENHLCEHDADGEVVRDASGNPVLECMCGNVIRGRTDPSLPFFTDGGSFWSNCTTRLLAQTTEKERQTRTRNRCNGEGYESVALIPLRAGTETIGLLQLNDSRTDQYTESMIGFLERVCEDIGNALARRQAEEALRVSEHRFRIISDQSLLGIAVIQDGFIKYANEQIAVNNGYPLEDILRWGVAEIGAIIHPDDRAFAIEQAKKKMAADPDVVTDYEYRIITRSGETRWLDQYSRTVQYDGRPADLVCQVDITERKQREEHEAELEEQLRHSQKMEAIGTLAGGIAHDFNNLLTPILGFSDMIAEGQDCLLPLQDVAANIRTAAQRASDLARQLLGFARKGKLLDTEVDIHRIISETVSILARTIDRRITISLELKASPSTVRGDPGQLSQVFMNLAVNARDAMPRGGQLSFRTDVVEIGPSGAETKGDMQPGQYVRIAVVDTGTGMSDDVRARVFEPFFTTHSDSGGTGMGLAMVYGITTNHGGHVEIESAPDKGAAFSVYLPVHEKNDQPPDRDTSAAAARNRDRGTVLIVDDELVVRATVASMLLPLGYETVQAADGAEALDIIKARTDSIDLILLDLTMPVMDGDEFYRHLQDTAKDIPVILASGHALEGTAQELLDAGAAEFLQKPFLRTELTAAIRRTLSRR